MYSKNLDNNIIKYNNTYKLKITDYSSDFLYYMIEDNNMYSKIVKICTIDKNRLVNITIVGKIRHFYFDNNSLYVQFFKNIPTKVLYKNRYQLHRITNYLQ